MPCEEMEFIEKLREIPLDVVLEIMEKEAERAGISCFSLRPETPAFEPG